MIRTSVIIPAYNSAATVGKAIDSAIRQEPDRPEIIVVNDGSTDATSSVLKRYDSAIRVIDQTNSGPSGARNVGVTAANAEFVALLDADDTWLPGRLQHTVSALENNPKAVMAFCDYIAIDESGIELSRSFAGRAPSHHDLLERTWPILPSAVTIRRSAFIAVGGFSEEFKRCGAEDHYLWMLLSERGEIEYVNDALTIYRCPRPGIAVDKYEQGARVFARLVTERYGGAAANLLRESHSYFSGILLAAAAAELDAGNVREGLRMLRRSLWYRPLLFFSPKVAVRLINIRNVKRIAKSLTQIRWRESKPTS